MLHHVIFVVALALSLSAPAFAAEKALPVCTVKALTQNFEGGVHYEIGLREDGMIVV